MSISPKAHSLLIISERYITVAQKTNRQEGERDRQREREREKERQRERQRETETQTDRDTNRETQKEQMPHLILFSFKVNLDSEIHVQWPWLLWKTAKEQGRNTSQEITSVVHGSRHTFIFEEYREKMKLNERRRQEIRKASFSTKQAKQAKLYSDIFFKL